MVRLLEIVEVGPDGRRLRLRDQVMDPKVKANPGQRFRLALYTVATTAYKACDREKARFKLSEPNILIESGLDPDVDGWGVYATYIAPKMIREEA